MITPTGIENEQARQYAAGAAVMEWKEITHRLRGPQGKGPNQGRLFVKCRHCGFFLADHRRYLTRSWIACPPPSNRARSAQGAPG